MQREPIGPYDWDAGLREAIAVEEARRRRQRAVWALEALAWTAGTVLVALAVFWGALIGF